MDQDLLFDRKLCEIASRIIERNQTENTIAYATTQDIDERLENLAKEMPPPWWSIPQNMALEPSPEAALQFDHIIMQIWYFQLEALLHLPFMLRAATERKYEYSKFSCLKASREMIHRYLAIRLAQNRSFCCKVIDFSALTATVTLLIDLLDPTEPNESRETRLQKEGDRALVHTILQKLEELSFDSTEVVATQCVNVLKKLIAADLSSSPTTGSIRLTIPYFGTINIARSSSAQTNLVTPMAQHQQVIPEQQPMPRPSQSWDGLPYSPINSTNIPVVSFTSSQFPPLMPETSMQDWRLPEADTLFFDSLFNTDIEGNWIF